MIIRITVIIILILTFSIGCSEKKVDKTSDEKFTKIYQESREGQKRADKSKIDFLCMKYDVESEALRKDLFEYLYKDIWSILDNDGKKNEKQTINFDELFYGAHIDSEKIKTISKKHNVPIKIISGIVYDYMIWKELEKRNESHS